VCCTPIANPLVAVARYFHILIGKEGSGIRALENAFNIKVVMPAQRVTDDSKPQYVKLVGSKASIERAKAEIKAMMKCYYFPTVTPGLTHVEIDLPEGQLRDLIGHRGATIKSIQGDTKCRIHTPKPQSVNPKVVVVGAPADVARAQTQITRALERAVENREVRYNERFDDYDEDYDDEEY
jgi:ribosomal protein S3